MSRRPSRLPAPRARVPLAVETLEDRLALSTSTPVISADHYESGHILVQFRNAAAARATLPGTHLGEAVPLVKGLFQIDLDAGVTVEQAVAWYRAAPKVVSAEPDYQIQVNFTPNDTNYSSLWGLNNTGQTGGTIDADIDAPEAWDVNRGNGRIVVAVIDSGVDYTHPDLAANVWRNSGEVAGNGIDDDRNGYVDDVNGYDFANNDGNPMDDNGHGTHVAGTIGAVGNNGRGVTGVVSNVKLMPLKFLDASGSGSVSNALRALNYAVANGARISNNSWGSAGGYSSSFAAGLANARNAGHIFVAAAGNDGTNNDTTSYYPSNYNYDNVVSVAATDHKNALASFSNYGPTTVDLAAPGVNIRSTTPNNSYGTKSGTSMAAPHVAGALALVWDQNPSLTYKQVINAVLNNVDPVASLGGKVISGGRLNVNKAIRSVPVDSTSPHVTSAVWSGGAGSLTALTVTFSEPLAAGTFTASDVVNFTGPDGTPMTVSGVTAVAGSNQTSFEITFASQSAPGSYALTFGPDIRDVVGNRMDNNGDGTADQYTTAATLANTVTKKFNSGTVSLPIKDAGTTIATMKIQESMTITDLNVRVNLSHTYDADLAVYLVAPSGMVVTLIDRRGGAGNNFTDTVLDDEATRSLGFGAAPFSGSFQPDSALAAFDGQNSQGTWKLKVVDSARRDTGTLNSWSLTITGIQHETTVRTLGHDKAIDRPRHHSREKLGESVGRPDHASGESGKRPHR